MVRQTSAPTLLSPLTKNSPGVTVAALAIAFNPLFWK